MSNKSIPIVEEQLVVSRETDELGAVRVRVESSSHTETFNAPVTDRRVEIERVSRNTVAEQVTAPWKEGDVLVIPVYREVMVKQLILVEEIRLVPVTEIRQQAVSVELRSESPVIERREATGDWHQVLPARSQ